MKALEKARQLAKPLETGIEILAVQTIPYSLPLNEPSVRFEFLVRRLEQMAAQFSESIQISAYLCRKAVEALKLVLNRDFPVMIGIRKKWWPTRDDLNSFLIPQPRVDKIAPQSAPGPGADCGAGRY